jgi:hypothetical protein
LRRRKFCHPAYCGRLVSDDENNQAATNEALDVLRFIAPKRLERFVRNDLESEASIRL